MKVKTFLNNDELIECLKEKGIIINNEEYVREILRQNNYYVIMGYKHLFLDKDKKYKKNVSFENIYNLYLFDKKLRLIILDNLLDVESIIKTSIINRFCKIYGFTEKEYLDEKNFNVNHKYLDKMLLIFKSQIIEKEKNHSAISYYKNNYGFIPLWVASKVMSFGVLREFYSVMKDDDKIAIKDEISNYDDIKIKHIFTFMQLFVDMRNRTAHDEIVFNEKHKRILLPKLKEHSKFNLSNNNGLNDLLAVFISMKNILNKKKFNLMINNIDNLINEYVKNNIIICKDELLEEMNLPSNYLDLKW